MEPTSAAGTLHERQVRIIGQVSSIQDPELLGRIERVIDAYRSGLRSLDDAEMDAILHDLRQGFDPDDDLS